MLKKHLSSTGDTLISSQLRQSLAPISLRLGMQPVRTLPHLSPQSPEHHGPSPQWPPAQTLAYCWAMTPVWGHSHASHHGLFQVPSLTHCVGCVAGAALRKHNMSDNTEKRTYEYSRYHNWSKLNRTKTIHNMWQDWSTVPACEAYKTMRKEPRWWHWKWKRKFDNETDNNTGRKQTSASCADKDCEGCEDYDGNSQKPCHHHPQTHRPPCSWRHQCCWWHSIGLLCMNFCLNFDWHQPWDIDRVRVSL